MRHAEPGHLARGRPPALLPLLQAQEAVPAPHPRRVLVHDGAGPRPARPHARARPLQADLGRGRPQVRLARQHQDPEHPAAQVGFQQFLLHTDIPPKKKEFLLGLGKHMHSKILKGLSLGLSF